MKVGQASRTAVLVCMGRAVGHKRNAVKQFCDPTALALLPEEARARVERFEAGVQPKGLRARMEQGYLRNQSSLMVARTVEIDEAIREARAPQLVILGAGLDGRAWRMSELESVTVFEVDHPDSQHDKRARVSALTSFSKDTRFVPVDFTKDSLDEALTTAGHDATRPTAWVWEGVVMYLTPKDVETTLTIIARRSAPKSRLVVTYHSSTPMRWFIGIVVRTLGEPLRSVYTKDRMRALLAKHGFVVAKDRDIPAISAALSMEEEARSRYTRHFRIATADRVGASLAGHSPPTPSPSSPPSQA